jgi:hypothetical protein
MTLDDWNRLSPEAQNRHRKSWRDERFSRWSVKAQPDSLGRPWFNLVKDARDRFLRQFGGNPLILSVSAGWGFFPEPAISVTTALAGAQRVTELPDRYCGFLVLQNPLLHQKQLYLKEWKLVLGKMLGWTPDRVRKWVRVELKHNMESDFFYHRQPFWYICRLFVPDALWHMNGREAIALSDRIELAVTGRYQCVQDVPEYDWSAARRRLRNVFKEYGLDGSDRLGGKRMIVLNKRLSVTCLTIANASFKRSEYGWDCVELTLSKARQGKGRALWMKVASDRCTSFKWSSQPLRKPVQISYQSENRRSRYRVQSGDDLVIDCDEIRVSTMRKPSKASRKKPLAKPVRSA